MKTCLYYHVYLTDDPGIWSSIVYDQLRCIETSDLLKHLENINITCITQNDSRFDCFYSLLSTYGIKFKIHKVINPYKNDIEMYQNIESSKTITENFTYQKIYQDSLSDDFIVGYIHTKGITAINHLLRGNAHKFKAYQGWRQLLNFGVIENWEVLIPQLKNYDVAGINLQKEPHLHYSGNFWWANSKYIRTLPDPSTIDWFHTLQKETTNHWLKHASDRFRDEQWLCYNKNVKAFNLYSPTINPAGEYLSEKTYRG